MTVTAPVDRPIQDRLAPIIVWSAIAISVVHYTDNTLRFDDYPPGDDGWLNPPLVVFFWALFTAAGLFGLALYRRRQYLSAAALFVFCSVGGLISPLHYTEGQLHDFDAFQHVNITLDFIAGLALFSFAVWIALKPPS